MLLHIQRLCFYLECQIRLFTDCNLKPHFVFVKVKAVSTCFACHLLQYCQKICHINHLLYFGIHVLVIRKCRSYSCIFFFFAKKTMTKSPIKKAYCFVFCRTTRAISPIGSKLTIMQHLICA